MLTCFVQRGSGDLGGEGNQNSLICYLRSYLSKCAPSHFACVCWDDVVFGLNPNSLAARKSCCEG